MPKQHIAADKGRNFIFVDNSGRSQTRPAQRDTFRLRIVTVEGQWYAGAGTRRLSHRRIEALASAAPTVCSSSPAWLDRLFTK